VKTVDMAVVGGRVLAWRAAKKKVPPAEAVTVPPVEAATVPPAEAVPEDKVN
jgi:hypothetical protein